MEETLDYSCGVIRAQLDRTQKVLVQDVVLRLSPGETLALVGETGSGKTILAQSLMGVLPPNVHRHGGKIFICGKEIVCEKQLRAMLGKEIVYIPQNGYEFLNPPGRFGSICMTVLPESLFPPGNGLPLLLKIGTGGLFRAKIRNRPIPIRVVRRHGAAGDDCLSAVFPRKAPDCG